MTNEHIAEIELNLRHRKYLWYNSLAAYRY